jgi:outer membrane lipoprotein SlyB
MTNVPRLPIFNALVDWLMVFFSMSRNLNFRLSEIQTFGARGDGLINGFMGMRAVGGRRVVIRAAVIGAVGGGRDGHRAAGDFAGGRW